MRLRKRRERAVRTWENSGAPGGFARLNVPKCLQGSLLEWLEWLHERLRTRWYSGSFDSMVCTHAHISRAAVGKGLASCMSLATRLRWQARSSRQAHKSTSEVPAQTRATASRT